jgi:hypothetical protein
MSEAMLDNHSSADAESKSAKGAFIYGALIGGVSWFSGKWNFSAFAKWV